MQTHHRVHESIVKLVPLPLSDLLRAAKIGKSETICSPHSPRPRTISFRLAQPPCLRLFDGCATIVQRILPLANYLWMLRICRKECCFHPTKYAGTRHFAPEASRVSRVPRKVEWSGDHRREPHRNSCVPKLGEFISPEIPKLSIGYRTWRSLRGGSPYLWID